MSTNPNTSLSVSNHGEIAMTPLTGPSSSAEDLDTKTAAASAPLGHGRRYDAGVSTDTGTGAGAGAGVGDVKEIMPGVRTANPVLKPYSMDEVDAVYVKGRKGTVQEVLGDYFQEQKRSSCSAFSRVACAVGCCFTGIGCLYLSSKHSLVPDGFIGISDNNGHPEILGPGRHITLSPLNSSISVRKVTDPHINLLTLHIVTVSDDKFGLASEQKRPLVLLPGIHVFDSPFFEFDRLISQNTDWVSHSTFHRVIVRQGTRGIAWEGNTPLLLEAGIYEWVSPLFEFVKAVSVDQDVVDLQPYTIVTVDDGRVGVCYRRGILSVLKPGEHWLSSEVNERFVGFLPMTQQVRELKPLDVLTNDGLMVRIKGSITFSICDPEVAVIHIGSDSEAVMVQDRRDNLATSLFRTIMKRANDTLASLLTGTDVLTAAGLGFAEHSIAASGIPGDETMSPEQMRAAASAVDAEAKQKQSERELNSVIRSRFKSTLTQVMMDEWGVRLSDMNVTDIDVLDSQVREALAEGVRCNIVAVTERRTAESKAETARILASGERDAANYKTDSETYNVYELALAQKKAGDLLGQTPVAVTIRLAETAAQAISNSQSSLIISQDASLQSLLQVIGASKMVGGVPTISTGNGQALSRSANANDDSNGDDNVSDAPRAIAEPVPDHKHR
jgi:regulator of protease activity HflC (stomatin/prohibitin superfamily)